ncbi:MAG: ADP-ribosylglycohydrolase family protein [Opitutales bacterium]
MDLLERFYGSILGLAVGDCLGMPWEFQSRGSFPQVTSFAKGGAHNAQWGEWSDDTSMAMCLAETLIRHQGWNAADAADRFRQWYRAGYWSAREACFDIGNATRQAIEQFEKSHDPFSSCSDEASSGNGSIMRLAPIAMTFYKSARLFEIVAESSRLTHGSRTCLDACHLMASVFRGILQGRMKSEILSVSFLQKNGPELGYCEAIAPIVQCDFRRKAESDIQTTGYVAHTLEAALYCWAHTNTYRDAVLMAVNLGDDTDTTAAVTGQIVGAFTGLSGIPSNWHKEIVYRRQIISVTEGIYYLSQKQS